MKKLNETQMDEIQAVNHYIRYVNTSPTIKDFEIWDAIMRLEEIGKKYVLNGFDEKEISEFLEFEDLQELMAKFFSRLRRKLDIPSDDE